jgi:hypothetical protein
MSSHEDIGFVSRLRVRAAPPAMVDVFEHDGFVRKQVDVTRLSKLGRSASVWSVHCRVSCAYR